MSYQVPQTKEERRKDFNDNLNIFNTEYLEFQTKKKSAAGSRAKKALTTVKKLITFIRRDIQAEIDLVKSAKKEVKTEVTE